MPQGTLFEFLRFCKCFQYTADPVILFQPQWLNHRPGRQGWESRGLDVDLTPVPALLPSNPESLGKFCDLCQPQFPHL